MGKLKIMIIFIKIQSLKCNIEYKDAEHIWIPGCLWILIYVYGCFIYTETLTRAHIIAFTNIFRIHIE